MGVTMRWLWLLIAVCGFGLAFATRSPGLLALGVFAGFVGLLGFAFAMAAARIAATAQPAANLIADAEVSALRARANQKRNTSGVRPTSANDQSNRSPG
jgi:hypothetical protein